MGFAVGGILPWHVAIRSYYHCIWLLINYCMRSAGIQIQDICMEGELPIHKYYILVTLRFMYVFGATVYKTKYYC